jgi:hypothetical protein
MLMEHGGFIYLIKMVGLMENILKDGFKRLIINGGM